MECDNRNKGGRPRGVADFRPPPGQLDPREAQLLVNRYIHGMTLADSAMSAGYACSNRNSAASRAQKVIDKHRDGNSEFLAAIERAGISADELATKLSEGLNAMQTVRTGEDSFEDKPDHRTRHKFLETALDIVGARAPKKVEITELSFEERLFQIIAEDEGNEPPII